MDNVFFLYGNDGLAISRRLKEFEADFPDSSSAEMNIARLEAAAVNQDELNTAVNAMPFLASRRLVLLAEPSKRYTRPDERGKFLEFLAAIPETARFVMHEFVETRNYKDVKRREKEDQKHWLVKWGTRTGIQLERFALPSAWEMAGWIVNETRQRNGQIEQSAAVKLAEMVGVNTRQAGQEITKLLDYVNRERQITVRDVETVSIVTAQESVFEFVDALATRNGRDAQHLLHRLMENEDPFSLWGMVVRQFRLLLQAREVIEAGGGKKDVARLLGVHPFVAEKTTRQAQQFQMPLLENVYRKLLEIDGEIKSSQVTIDLALDILVVELTGG